MNEWSAKVWYKHSTFQKWGYLTYFPFIKLYNINVKVLYKQADMGFAAEAGLLF